MIKNMDFPGITSRTNEIAPDKMKIGMKIVYGFIAIDAIWLIAWYIAYNHENISFINNPDLVMVISILSAIVFSVIICAILARSIIKPVKELNNTVKKMSNRDITIMNMTSRDELYSSKLASKAKELSGSGQKMRTSIDQISNDTSGISEGSLHQSEKIENVKKIISEMSIIMNQIMIGSERTAQVSKESNNIAKELRGNSNDLSSKILDIQRSVNECAVIIKNLDRKSEKIGEIIGAIKNIANQTNLLALNAAIEAARAGEHGKGFAVVANEVKTLADESGNSAKMITELIKEIQLETKKAVENMNYGTQIVTEGSKKIEATISSIDNIVEATESAASMFSEFIEISKIQENYMKNVDLSVEEISEISGKTMKATADAAAKVQEQAASMSILEDMANDLLELSRELKNDVVMGKNA